MKNLVFILLLPLMFACGNTSTEGNQQSSNDDTEVSVGDVEYNDSEYTSSNESTQYMTHEFRTMTEDNVCIQYTIVGNHSMSDKDFTHLENEIKSTVNSETATNLYEDPSYLRHVWTFNGVQDVVTEFDQNFIANYHAAQSDVVNSEVLDKFNESFNNSDEYKEFKKKAAEEARVANTPNDRVNTNK